VLSTDSRYLAISLLLLVLWEYSLSADGSVSCEELLSPGKGSVAALVRQTLHHVHKDKRDTIFLVLRGTLSLLSEGSGVTHCAHMLIDEFALKSLFILLDEGELTKEVANNEIQPIMSLYFVTLARQMGILFKRKKVEQAKTNVQSFSINGKIFNSIIQLASNIIRSLAAHTNSIHKSVLDFSLFFRINSCLI
jgi:hypothetical protein